MPISDENAVYTGLALIGTAITSALGGIGIWKKTSGGGDGDGGGNGKAETYRRLSAAESNIATLCERARSAEAELHELRETTGKIFDELRVLSNQSSAIYAICNERKRERD